MHVHVVYCHPSPSSFTAEVRDELLRGLDAAGHTWTLSDLYAMGFATDMTEDEYLRDAWYSTKRPLAPDVLAEQALVDAASALVFVYPVFWTEAPAKLVGWFDRVWRYGFAYGPSRSMRTLSYALFIAVAGLEHDDLVAQGRIASMRNVMLNDRIHDRAVDKQLVVLAGTSREDPERRDAHRERHLRRVYELAVGLGT